MSPFSLIGWLTYYLAVRITRAPRRLLCHQRSHLLSSGYEQYRYPERLPGKRSLPAISPHHGHQYLLLNAGDSTGGSPGVGSSDPPQKMERATDDLELGDLHDFTVKMNLPAKCSTADISVWEAQEFHSQECLKVN